MAGNIVGILFDGLAYGSLLFLVGVGLSITMGLMNFINLAHGSFAMIGGYASVYLANRAGIPFLATLPLAFVAAGLCGIVAERLLFQRLYKAPHLDQMLFTVGFVFSSIAAAHYFFGASQQFVAMPDMLQGQVRFMGVDFGKYRLLLIAFVAAVTLALHLMLSKTRFGAEIRAAVDNQDAAAGLGINVNLVFALCFALGTGLAGLGGALGVEVLGLDPTFPLKYMVYFLLVVVVGGAGSIRGPLIAALLLGVFDVAGKYFVPEIGAFIIYVMMIVLLIAFPSGLGGKRA
ncbi:MAG: branched-chain amino acid ABC transporter permease [Martelella sp.]|uniref:branched-chain amino acid ABC transporter permease n=1 Tax=unclassified Martelella TaxID=2629616 RepID=UPI000C5EF1BD|nr:branched-chain amino acid ABC transporter permease [Martelella sp.]MAU21657.1 branched-chain amino acid ABC transporter permease [Martelella sp.]|tara:strand:+ start:1368 stop:2234 length:867 start_codon:yes stop_codon:yes gene_type:complete